MKKTQAISRIQNQISKVSALELDSTTPWRNQTVSLLQEIFGSESLEAKYFDGFHFSMHYVRDEYQQSQYFAKQKQVIKTHLQNCIETVEQRRIRGPEKKNVLAGIGNEGLITIIIALCGFSFWIGSWTSSHNNDIQNSKNEQEISKLKDSLAHYRRH